MSSEATNQPACITSQLLEEDPELRDIVEEFVVGLPGRVQELHNAFAQLDWEQLTVLAHQLKGAGGSYGYPDISNHCAMMERNFRDHNADEFKRWAQELEQLAQAANAGLAS